MASYLMTLLETLRKQVVSIKKRNAELEARNRELSEENASLLRDMEKVREERDRALLDVEFMAVSHKLADNPDNLILARRKIAGLIRNIDRCLEMMKE